MASGVRARVRRALASGELTADSPLTETTGIGPYLEGRLRRALRAAAPLTVGDLWRGLRRRPTARVELLLHRALQNERANQCVASDARTAAAPRDYHAGDVNQHGYEACAALLEHARAADPAGVRYGALPRALPARSASSKGCGCRADDECVAADGLCARAADGACVPRAHNARGFVGAAPHPHQSERAADAPRVRRASRARADGRRDPDVRRDSAAGHARALRYSRRGSRLWRRPGSKVRRPLVTR